MPDAGNDWFLSQTRRARLLRWTLLPLGLIALTTFVEERRSGRNDVIPTLEDASSFAGVFEAHAPAEGERPIIINGFWRTRSFFCEGCLTDEQYRELNGKRVEVLYFRTKIPDNRGYRRPYRRAGGRFRSADVLLQLQQGDDVAIRYDERRELLETSRAAASRRAFQNGVFPGLLVSVFLLIGIEGFGWLRRFSARHGPR